MRTTRLPHHPPDAKQDRRRWALALAGTLLVHVLAGWGLTGTWLSPPRAPSEPPPLRLVFAANPPAFTELPPDQADTPPEQADLLSNVTSRARDNRTSGRTSQPRQAGRSPSPAVALEPGAPTAEAAPPRPSNPEAVSPVVRQERGPGAPPQTQPANPSMAGLLRRPGLGDAPQEASSGAGATLTGEISLNTTAWDYAPWLMRFRREVMSNWFAPSAFRMGIIHGWTLVELRIRRDGHLESMQVLGEEGHSSLRESSVGAFRATQPFAPLPAHFPEEELVLRIRMIYPEPIRR